MHPLVALICSILTVLILGCVMALGIPWRTGHPTRQKESWGLIFFAILVVSFFILYQKI